MLYYIFYQDILQGKILWYFKLNALHKMTLNKGYDSDEIVECINSLYSPWFIFFNSKMTTFYLGTLHQTIDRLVFYIIFSQTDLCMSLQIWNHVLSVVSWWLCIFLMVTFVLSYWEQKLWHWMNYRRNLKWFKYPE